MTSFLLGVWIGTIEAVAICYTIAVLLALYPAFAISGKLIEMTFADVVKSVAGILGCSSVMALVIGIVRVLLPSDWPHWLYLATLVPFGLLFYLVTLHFCKIQAFSELKEILTQRLLENSLLAGINPK